MDEINSCTPIKVGFNHDYFNAITTYSRHSLKEHWIELADRLASREGWHCDVVNLNELMWSFGTFGGSLLNIQVIDNGEFGCFDYLEDETVNLKQIEDVGAWINQREARARSSDLETSKQFLSADSWHGLRNYPFELDIDYVDSAFVGVISGGAHEPTFAYTLVEVIKNAKQMIAAYFGADVSLINQINVRCHLTEVATKNFMIENN